MGEPAITEGQASDDTSHCLTAKLIVSSLNIPNMLHNVSWL